MPPKDLFVCCLVYDYQPVTELVQERILLINEGIVECKIKEHGPPPSDIDAQKGWYRDNLRETLRIASRTRLVVSKPQTTTDTTMVATTPREPAPVVIMEDLYNATEPGMMQHDTSVVHQSQLPMMNRPISAMSLPPQPFFQSGQHQQSDMLRTLSNVTPSSVSSGMVWDSPQTFVYDSPQAFNTVSSQQGYNNHPGYNAPIAFTDQNFTNNTVWQESNIGQSPSWTQLQQPERRQ